MEYQPKVVLCRLHMAGKTIQQIREECAGQGMTYRDFENIQRANEYFDGVRCRLSLWEWDNYKRIICEGRYRTRCLSFRN